MGNKIWIALLWMCSFVFGVGACASIWIGITEKMFWHPMIWFLWMSLLAWGTAKMAISRIKYGPQGPPPDPIDDFDIDF